MTKPGRSVRRKIGDRPYASMAVGIPGAVVCVAVLLFSTAAATAAAPAAATARPRWSAVSVATAPADRDRFAMAYDTYDKEAVLFGGYNPNQGGIYGDTWTFANGSWTQLSFGYGSAPSARSGDVLVNDPLNKGVLLFGGEVYSSYYGDTWLFHAGAWTQLSPAHSPSARSQYTMAYDGANGRPVLFGGTDGSDLSDTWEWNGTDWQHMGTTTAPPGRQFAVMGYDAVDKELILTGGLNSSSTSGISNTWVFKGGNWSLSKASPHPQALVQAMMVTLPNGSLLLFGGQEPVLNVFVHSTWVFTKGAWVHVYYTSPPTNRKAGGLVYDRAQGYVLQFGGNDVSVWLGDTWALKGLPP